MPELTRGQYRMLLTLVLLQSTIAPLITSGLIPSHMDKLTATWGEGTAGEGRGVVGTALATSAMIAGLFGLMAGALAERIGNLRVLMISIAGQALMPMAFLFTPNGGVAAFEAMIFFGAVNMTCVANAISSEFFSGSRKRGVNLLHAVNATGKLAGPLLALVFAGMLWRWGFFAVGVYGLAILALGFAVIAQGVHSREAAGLSPGAIIHRPLFWVCTLGFVLLVAAEFTVATWLPTYLERVHGYSDRMKKIMLMLFMGGIVSGRFAVAWLGYRMTHRQIMGICVGCAFFLVPAMLTTGHPAAAGALLLLHGIAFSAAYPTHFAYITRFFPGKRAALSGGAGLANSIGYAIGYVAAGWISEWSLSAAVLMGPALMAVYAILFITLNLREKKLTPA